MNLSAEEDPYSLEKYPTKYQIVIGKQAHNARQLVKAAQAKGAYLNMYRQPLTPAQINRLQELVPHARVTSTLMARMLATLQYRQVAASGVLAGYTRAQTTAVFQEIILRIMQPRGAPAGTSLAELQRRVRNASARVATEVLPPTARLNFSPARMALARAQLDLARARQSRS